MIAGVIITKLQVIQVASGNVLHAIKAKDDGFVGFGEAYFSCIKSGSIKSWKKHNRMILNLVVPVGAIRFVLFDDRIESDGLGKFMEIKLGLNQNYSRLTVPAGVWMAFEGISKEDSILLNIANIPHDPSESERRNLDEIKYQWGG